MRYFLALAALVPMVVTAALVSPTATAEPAAQAGPTAAQLLAKLTSCQQISKGTYRTDTEKAPSIPVCDKSGAVWYKADMDIDCDGQPTPRCNKNTDPWFQPETAFQDSKGKHLVADQLPYTVVPSPSGTWDYRKWGIQGGGIVAVIYNDKVQYTVVGDTGPSNIIGEASYATASALGINPDPANGGTDSGVTYIVLKGNVPSPVEDNNAITSKGQSAASAWLNG